MIKTTDMLREELSEYRYTDNKISRMVQHGELSPIVRGLYETDPKTPGYFLAASIYGPSYLSFEYALSYWGLIPEAVYVYTSATFQKRKKKQFETPFGVFTYRDVPADAFPMGILIRMENNRTFLIADAEKALCDLLYTISPLTSIKAMRELLTEDLRIDEESLEQLDHEKLHQYAERYRTKNHRLLVQLLRRM